MLLAFHFLSLCFFNHYQNPSQIQMMMIILFALRIQMICHLIINLLLLQIFLDLSLIDFQNSNYLYHSLFYFILQIHSFYEF
jgi:hypothetical protein